MDWCTNEPCVGATDDGLLKDNVDMFAWKPADLQGIGLKVIVHRLNIDSNTKPIKLEKRNFGIERNKMIEVKINKLLETG